MFRRQNSQIWVEVQPETQICRGLTGEDLVDTQEYCDLRELDLGTQDYREEATQAPKTEGELRGAILHAYDRLDLDKIGAAVTGPKRGFLARCRACIEAKGGHFAQRLEK